MEHIYLERKDLNLVDAIPELYGKFDGTCKKYTQEKEKTPDVLEQIAEQNYETLTEKDLWL